MEVKEIERRKMNIYKEKMYKLFVKDQVVHAVADASNDGMLLFDKKHRLVLINREFISWTKWIGINIKDWVGALDKEIYKKLSEFIEESELFESLYQSVAGKENLIAETIDITLKNEIYKYLNVYTAPVYTKDEGYFGRIWIFDDRTTEVKVDKMKTEFISLASHQLRTPLTIITGYLSMLLEGDAGKMTKEVTEYVQNAFSGAEELIEIVEGLLKISRLDSGSIKPNKGEYDIKKMMQDTVKLYEEEAKKKGIKIKHKYSTLNMKFKTDAKLLKQAIGNLLDNAIKYSANDTEVVLKVRIKNLDKERKLFISVADQGVGIPKEQQQDVFTKFFRADNVRTKDFKGTGLGLYYVRSVISSLNGKVWFKSKLGKGTTFFVEILE